MPKVDVYDIAGKKVDTVELKDEVFGIEPNEAVVQCLLFYQLCRIRLP